MVLPKGRLCRHTVSGKIFRKVLVGKVNHLLVRVHSFRAQGTGLQGLHHIFRKAGGGGRGLATARPVARTRPALPLTVRRLAEVILLTLHLGLAILDQELVLRLEVGEEAVDARRRELAARLIALEQFGRIPGSALAILRTVVHERRSKGRLLQGGCILDRIHWQS